ncbi:MAG: hypothetical protein NDI60_09890 [Elusimicrobiales bacterium]|nr:hypothetical protein [Elusimicrobiales bacterium]
MKFSAAIVLSLFLAVPAAAEWPPSTDARALEAFAAPVPEASAAFSPREGRNYSGAEELLIKEFRIDSIGMDISEAEVMRQSRFYVNTFCFEHALRLALTDLLENYSSPTSPLARALGELGAQQTPTKTELKKARQKVLAALDTPQAFIAIVAPRAQNQPAGGETLEENWIFFVRLEGKPYWVIVNRAGAGPSYTYGLD